MPIKRSQALAAIYLATAVTILGTHQGLIPPFFSVFAFAGLALSACLHSLQTGLCVLILTNPFYLIIRNAYPNSIELSGVRTIIILIIYAIFLANLADKPRQKKLNRKTAILLLSSALAFLSFLFPSLAEPSISKTLLGIREYLFIIPLTIVVAMLHSWNRIEIQPLLNAFYASGICITVLHLLNYFGAIGDLHSLLSEKTYNERQLFGALLPRMTSYIGHGPSGAALFFSSLLPIALYKSRTSTNLKKGLHLIIAVTLTLSILLCLSFTGVICIAIAIFTFGYTSKSQLSLIVKPLFAFATIALLWNLLINQSFLQINLLEYLANASQIPLEFVPQTFEEWTLGTGWHLASGAISGTEFSKQVDAGWMGILNQFGIFGFLFISTWFAMLLLSSGKRIAQYRLDQNSASTQTLTAASIAVICFFSLHDVTFALRPTDINFIIFASSAFTSRLTTMQPPEYR